MMQNNSIGLTSSVKYKLLIMCLLYFGHSVHAQHSIYNYSLKKDGTIIGVGLGLGTLGFILQKNIKPLTQLEVDGLKATDIWSFDRKAIGINSSGAGLASDLLSYSAILLPTSLLFSKIEKKDKKALMIMSAETLLYTDAITRLVKVAFLRKRPYVYDPNIPFDDKTTPGAQSSFPSGHTSKTAAFTFITANFLDDLFPNSNYKPYYWAGAIALPALTGYFRVRASKHFPTDVLGGYILGAGIGFLVPEIHKSDKLRLNMDASGGLGLVYIF